MANEITMQVYLAATKGTASIIRQPGTFQADWTGKKYSIQTFALSDTPAALVTGGITAPGWVYMRNTSPVVGVQSGEAYISLDGSTTTPLVLLRGEASLFRVADDFDLTDIEVSCTAAEAVQLEVTVLEK